MHKDLYHCVKPVNGLTSVASTGAEEISGTIIDTEGYESGQIAVIVTALTNGTAKIKEILESDVATDTAGVLDDATVIPADQLIGDYTVELDVAGVHDVGFVRNKRYVQPVFETVGASVGLTLNGVVNLGHAETTRESEAIA